MTLPTKSLCRPFRERGYLCRMFIDAWDILWPHSISDRSDYRGFACVDQGTCSCCSNSTSPSKCLCPPSIVWTELRR